MSAPLRLLVVTPDPDDRESTAVLRSVVAELDRRPDVEVAVWFLRAYESDPWPGARNVDALRSWWVGRGLELAGLGRLAAGLRGRRLRSWFRRVRPDVVLLDDGLGARLLPSAPAPPLVVVRHNPAAPRWVELEPTPLESGDLVVSMAPAGAGGPWLLAPHHLEGDPPRQLLAETGAARATARHRWGVPEEAPIVVGWGDDGWLDGTDLFVRVLWYLQDRHGVRAHGVWLGLPDDDDEADRLRAEAHRCGVGERFHLVAEDRPGDHWAGDVAFLPYRVPIGPGPLVEAAVVSRSVVLFGPTSMGAPWVHEVELLDLDAAADAIVAALADRTDWRSAASIPGWVDLLLAKLAEAMGAGARP